MNLVDSFADVSRFVRLRRDIHAHPELGFEESRTPSLVAAKLREWGLDVAEGVGKTGVVGTLDALTLTEQTGKAYASQTHGVMHACDHDGPTTMLLGTEVSGNPIVIVPVLRMSASRPCDWATAG